MYESGKNGKTEASGAAEIDSIVCYVDGSYNPEAGKYAYGCLFVDNEGKTFELCGSGDNSDALLQRNVAGEMIASMLAVKWARAHKYKALDIYYDYSGIECWVTGEWKAKNDLTKKYRDWMQVQQAYIKLRFFKVQSHSGVKYNEMADKLAKQGLLKEPGLPEINV